MSKSKAQSPKPKVAKARECRRCFCTEERACPGGCSWVQFSDVCDQCLTPGEDALYEELLVRMVESNTDASRASVTNCLKDFGAYVNNVSADVPLRFTVVKRGGK